MMMQNHSFLSNKEPSPTTTSRQSLMLSQNSSSMPDDDNINNYNNDGIYHETSSSSSSAVSSTSSSPNTTISVHHPLSPARRFQDAWLKYNLDTMNNNNTPIKTYHHRPPPLNLNGTTRAVEVSSCAPPIGHFNMRDEDVEERQRKTISPEVENGELMMLSITSPSHHARRPMNAFLIFCKKHRSIVRQKFPNLENRGVTRILGEWWALLEVDDKAPYTDLAKEYKDAFLSANPDFKWYKLPAPPLRSPLIRRTSTTPANALKSPTNSNNFNNSALSSTKLCYESDFNPGKLADESQLGSLTNLFGVEGTNRVTEANNNNLEEDEQQVETSRRTIDDVPPKPLKKRIVNGTYEQYSNNNHGRHLINTNGDATTSIATDQDHDFLRKSNRQCKGKRYEQFMVEGKLLGNKMARDVTKLTSQQTIGSSSSSSSSNSFKSDITTPTYLEDEDVDVDDDDVTILKSDVHHSTPSSGAVSSNSNTNDFQLDVRIQNLPSLSYDAFWQRKRDNKKRKSNPRTNNNNNNGKSAPSGAVITTVDHHGMVEGGKKRAATNHRDETGSNEQLCPIGAKKRKNKQSITHLGAQCAATEEEEQLINSSSGGTLDLMGGLATLAEVAANTQKIV